VLSRQKLPTFDRSRYAGAEGLACGAYIMAGAKDRTPDVILIASGSEVQLCISAYERLKQEGIAARVVSMPSWELFEAQDRHYREEILPPSVKARIAVEAGAVIGRSRRNDHRHASFRRLGARNERDAKIRVYCRARIAGC
jgi:transketolase